MRCRFDERIQTLRLSFEVVSGSGEGWGSASELRREQKLDDRESIASDSALTPIEREFPLQPDEEDTQGAAQIQNCIPDRACRTRRADREERTHGGEEARQPAMTRTGRIRRRPVERRAHIECGEAYRR
jgi:hypothetical protein